MKIVTWVLIALVLGLAIVGIAAPIGPMPGLLISGTTSEIPSSWGDTSSNVEVDLQVGEGPIGRTVTIWIVQVEGTLYVTGQKNKGWTSGIADGGAVRVKMDGKLYNLTAEPIREDAVKVLTAWQAKYANYYPERIEQFPTPEDQTNRAVVYKLTKRG